MASNTIYGGLLYWLVDHPTISNFKWNKGTTFGSTPHFLALTVTTYLSLTFLLLKSPIPPPPPRLLRLFSILHNLTILLLSLAMAIGCTLSAVTHLPIKSICCFPVHQPRQGPVFFWAYVFYLSKILEFVDTALIILGGKGKGDKNSNGGNRRLSFLHVYHHAVVVVMCYVWLETAQSLFPVALVTNATVHTVMYGYYLMCALGFRPWWKRAVTNCQITQFVFSFVVSGVMLYYHFGIDEDGCSGFGGWCFNAVFNASLLYLFADFHKKNYQKNYQKKKSELKLTEKQR